jgi:O-antigen chain-terminating methyltransferase
MSAPGSGDGASEAAVADRRADGLRERAERLWPVTADRARPRPSGVRGLLTAPAKRLVGPLVRWYVAPLVDAQRDFNDVTLKLIDDLYEQLELRTDERLLEELEERILRLERAARAAAGSAAPAGTTNARAPVSPASPPPVDYFAFEARMRGSRADIRERQRRYIADFADAAPVLDVGCGRGEFLSLLREAGIAAAGVDSDRDMVEICRAEDLAVEHDDALAYLERLEDGSLGGVFAAQVVEHLPPGPLLRFLELASAKLRPGGVLVAETMNPLSFVALKNYFADLTHAQPLVPETLVMLARQAGFRSTDVRFLNPPPDEERLRPVVLPADPALDEARVALEANVARLNEVVFGPQDYALVGRT